MSQSRERAQKAFNAMKTLGISAETVRPILKRLYNLYDNKWELIEEDNYRTLADAIFEYEEDKLKGEKKTEILKDDTRTPSIKRDPEDEVSSTSRNGKKVLKPDGHEISRFPGPVKMVESSQSVSVDTTSKPGGLVNEAPTENKCLDLVLLNFSPDEEKLCSPQASSAMEKNEIDGSPQFAAPALCAHPDSNITSQHPDSKKKQVGSSSVFSSQTTYDIASSACGQVKISLTCKNTVWQDNFMIPCPDNILNFAQKFCNTEGSHFSLINLLNEFCESYLEAGSDSSKRPRLNKSPGKNTRCPLTSTFEYAKKEHPDGHLGKRASSSNKRAIRVLSDITNGTENIKISLLDETGSGDLPRYVYSPESITMESAYVHISLARISDDDCCVDCKRDCISCSIPCACARETGGEFAYTTKGLLSEKFLSSCISIKNSEITQPLFYCEDCPLERAKNGDKHGECKGHRYRKFIKECWRKCGCSMECGNRVVQRGITRKLQVSLSREKTVSISDGMDDF